LSLAGSRLTEQPLPDGGTPRQALLAHLDLIETRLIDIGEALARMTSTACSSTAGSWRLNSAPHVELWAWICPGPERPAPLTSSCFDASANRPFARMSEVWAPSTAPPRV
jgi:hypothetical protein